MSEPDNANKNQENTNDAQDDAPRSYLSLIILCGVIAFAGLLLASLYWPNLTERTKFFTGNLLNLVIALAVIGQVLIYRVQADIMKRQLKATETAARTAEKTADAVVSQLRAYISIAVQVLNVEEGKAPIAHIAIKNTGQTPAYKLTQISGIALGKSFETLPPPTGQTAKMSNSSIAPGEQNDMLVTAPVPLPAGAIAALHNGSLTLWAYGEIRYRDAFNIDRFKKFRFMMGGPVGVRENRVAYSEEGNEEN